MLYIDCHRLDSVTLYYQNTIYSTYHSSPSSLKTTQICSSFTNISITNHLIFITDGELFRSEKTVESLTKIPNLVELNIGQSENFSRKCQVYGETDFALILCQFASTAENSPIQKLEKLTICGSYLQRGKSSPIDDSLQNICTTFIHLKELAIKYASRLLGSLENIKSLSLLTKLEKLDIRKSEIAVLKVSSTTNYSVARTAAWCDEYLLYLPISLKAFYIETGTACLYFILARAIIVIYAYICFLVLILSQLLLSPSNFICRGQLSRYIQLYGTSRIKGMHGYHENEDFLYTEYRPIPL